MRFSGRFAFATMVSLLGWLTAAPLFGAAYAPPLAARTAAEAFLKTLIPIFEQDRANNGFTPTENPKELKTESPVPMVHIDRDAPPASHPSRLSLSRDSRGDTAGRDDGDGSRRTVERRFRCPQR